MCLSIKCEPTPSKRAEAMDVLVSKEDIHCFKVLRRNKDGILETPFRLFTYEPDVLYLSEFSFGAVLFLDEVTVEKGLHSCVTLESAVKIKEYLNEVWSYECNQYGHSHVIYHAVIPAGYPYYVGTFEDSGGSYASRGLKITKEVESCA